ARGPYDRLAARPQLLGDRFEIAKLIRGEHAVELLDDAARVLHGGPTKHVVTVLAEFDDDAAAIIRGGSLRDEPPRRETVNESAHARLREQHVLTEVLDAQTAPGCLGQCEENVVVANGDLVVGKLCGESAHDGDLRAEESLPGFNGECRIP